MGYTTEEHKQISEWLEELKFIRQWKADIMESFCKYDASSFEEIVHNARNKGIDDFSERIIEVYSYLPVSIVRALAEQIKTE